MDNAEQLQFNLEPNAADLFEAVLASLDPGVPMPERVEVSYMASGEVIGRMYLPNSDDYQPIYAVIEP